MVSIREPARVPQQILKDLLVNYARGNAIEQWKADGPHGTPVPHTGDSFGRVMAWAWAESADEDRFLAMWLLAEFLIRLRPYGARYTLDYILAGSGWLSRTVSPTTTRWWRPPGGTYPGCCDSTPRRFTPAA